MVRRIGTGGFQVGELTLAGAIFLGTHLGISSTGLRGMLVRAVGERPYLAIYSIVAAVTIGYLVVTFNSASHAEFLWAPVPALRWTSFLLMPFAFIFLLGGFMTRNPTAVGQEGSIKQVGEGRGLLRITRHPFQWSVVIWAVAHILANGDTASLIFFGSLGLVSLLGSGFIDRKKAAALGNDWSVLAAATSNVPFAAIVQGRNRLVLSELQAPILAGLAAYALVFWGHRWVSGVSLF